MKSGLTELAAVLAVARQRNFRAAADDLGMSRSALSHAVSALERRIGVRLFNRTTRSVSLTEAGEQFVASARNSLDDKNITSLELEVPIACVRTAADPVIAGWTTSSSVVTSPSIVIPAPMTVLAMKPPVLSL